MRTIKAATLLVALLLTISSCQTTPYTGTSRMNLMKREDELAMGKNASRQYLSMTRTCRDKAVVQRVKRVGAAIAAQADTPDANWQFHCVEDGHFQALCFPGGIIVVYSGVAETCKTDDELAAILGHEAGHAIASHSAKLLSKQAVVGAVTGGLGAGLAGLGGGGGYAAQGNAQALAALAAVGLLLPNSRENEDEADALGMILMAKAGYDPAQAVNIWRRLVDAHKGDKKASDSLSTHPADEKRLEHITAFVEKARAYAPGKPNATPQTTPEAPAAPSFKSDEEQQAPAS